MKRRIFCRGHWIHSVNGDDFDCDHENVGAFCCGDCIINGGEYSPQTGKRFRGNRSLYLGPDPQHARLIPEAF